jgi:hypothetical protein
LLIDCKLIDGFDGDIVSWPWKLTLSGQFDRR